MQPRIHFCARLAAREQMASVGQCTVLMQVLIIKTDGGPDRNTTFASVQLAFLGLALLLKLDAIILNRTAPGQSYVNPVERCMSVLNPAGQGLALERAQCPSNTEAVLKDANSMKQVREALAKADGDQRMRQTRTRSGLRGQCWPPSLCCRLHMRA